MPAPKSPLLRCSTATVLLLLVLGVHGDGDSCVEVTGGDVRFKSSGGCRNIEKVLVLRGEMLQFEVKEVGQAQASKITLSFGDDCSVQPSVVQSIEGEQPYLSFSLNDNIELPVKGHLDAPVLYFRSSSPGQDKKISCANPFEKVNSTHSTVVVKFGYSGAEPNIEIVFDQVAVYVPEEDSHIVAWILGGTGAGLAVLALGGTVLAVLYCWHSKKLCWRKKVAPKPPVLPVTAADCARPAAPKPKPPVKEPSDQPPPTTELLAVDCKALRSLDGPAGDEEAAAAGELRTPEAKESPAQDESGKEVGEKAGAPMGDHPADKTPGLMAHHKKSEPEAPPAPVAEALKKPAKKKAAKKANSLDLVDRKVCRVASGRKDDGKPGGVQPADAKGRHSKPAAAAKRPKATWKGAKRRDSLDLVDPGVRRVARRKRSLKSEEVFDTGNPGCCTPRAPCPHHQRTIDGVPSIQAETRTQDRDPPTTPDVTPVPSSSAH